MAMDAIRYYLTHCLKCDVNTNKDVAIRNLNYNLVSLLCKQKLRMWNYYIEHSLFQIPYLQHYNTLLLLS